LMALLLLGAAAGWRGTRCGCCYGRWGGVVGRRACRGPLARHRARVRAGARASLLCALHALRALCARE
jgi:hypothetical protein